MRLSDTICAVASGVGGGIGVVRISGPLAGEIVARLVRPWPPAPESHRLYHGGVHDPLTGERLDEVLACVMRAPRSYTGEEVAELHGHGGAANLRRLVDAAVRAGARVAEPGEFTRRAFLAGRIDLSRAEAVAEVIAARSERAVRLAQAQLAGGIAERVGEFRGRLIELMAEVEGGMDFPEADLDFVPLAALALRLAVLAEEVRGLAATHAQGRLCMRGFEVVLAGRPNAGKSSLLNALCGNERALVDAAPGTTRDLVEVELEIAGMWARLCDTAGERADGEVSGVERRGIELGRQRRAQADVVVLVVDGEAGFGEVERQLLCERALVTVVAWNKGDLSPAPTGLPEGTRAVVTVAPTGLGIGDLKMAIGAAAGDLGDDGGAIVSSARQGRALDEAAAALSAAGALTAAGQPPELAAVDLRAALEQLGLITGESINEAVLDELFARFCLGK
ncbi:MAG: tRNA uridine-5-carboxymethylaminomethyl(34) synthesis GTPase MnmE [Myxococcales bacterium]|nr:tRNA uridine-5-carboxymethylaminomethyl(34) synthesis GTPase MnmE [Myxococcales bacterium]